MRSDRAPADSEPVVLIVEDEAELADMYAEYLQTGCDVRVAYTGDDALELIDRSLDIAFLDRRLMEWSGDELVNVIHERGIDCGIVLVTAVKPDLDIAELPIDDYLEKPIFEEDLQQSVEEIQYRLIGGANQQEFLALVSRRIVLEDQFSKAQLKDKPEYAKLNRRIELAEEHLGYESSHQRSKHRPDACPSCDFRWDVRAEGRLGYVPIGTRVWKCTRCGQIEDLPDPSDRSVARR